MGWDMATHLVAAFVLGALIGLERQWRHRLSGMATHALVALGAASFVVVADLVHTPHEAARIVAQVVSGIGFLGAGVIIRDGFSVRGLSTAATVWCTGAVGALAGIGALEVAGTVAALMVGCNLLSPRLGAWMQRYAPVAPHTERCYAVELETVQAEEAWVRSALLEKLHKNGLLLQRLESRVQASGDVVQVQAQVVSIDGHDSVLEALVGELAMSPHISAVSWTAREVHA